MWVLSEAAIQTRIGRATCAIGSPLVHGLIFASFRDYLLTEHGPDLAHEITAGEPQYTLSEAYLDEQFVSLLERACTRTALTRDEPLLDFGTFPAAVTFARL